MPIQIPYHSQASPGRVPDVGGVRQPQGHWPTQQAVYTQTPRDKTSATEGMFSGGLQGLQSVANALGDAGKGFYQIAAQMRKQDDNNIKGEAAIAWTNTMTGMSAELESATPDQYQGIFDHYTNQYRDEVLSRDMPESLRNELRLQTAQRIASARGGLVEQQMRLIKDKALTETAIAARQMEADGDIAGLVNLYDTRTQDGTYMPWEAQEKLEISSERARESQWLQALEASGRPMEVDVKEFAQGPDEIRRAESAQRTIANRKKGEWADNIINNPDHYTDKMIMGLADKEYIDRDVAERLIARKPEQPLQPGHPQLVTLRAMVRDYDMREDPEQETEAELRYRIASIARANPIEAAMFKDLLDTQKKNTGPEPDMERDVRSKFKKEIGMLFGDTDEPALDSPEEAALYNKVDQLINESIKNNPAIDRHQLETKVREMLSDDGPTLKPKVAPLQTRLDARSANTLATVNAAARPTMDSLMGIAKQVAAKHGVEIKAIEGQRSQARQEELYAQGRTKPGKIVTWTKNSKHKSGNAVDLGVFKDGKYLDETQPGVSAAIYREIAAEAQKAGLTFKWGGTFGDYPHFEYRMEKRN